MRKYINLLRIDKDLDRAWSWSRWECGGGIGEAVIIVEKQGDFEFLLILNIEYVDSFYLCFIIYFCVVRFVLYLVLYI